MIRCLINFTREVLRSVQLAVDAARSPVPTWKFRLENSAFKIRGKEIDKTAKSYDHCIVTLLAC